MVERGEYFSLKLSGYRGVWYVVIEVERGGIRLGLRLFLCILGYGRYLVLEKMCGI